MRVFENAAATVHGFKLARPFLLIDSPGSGLVSIPGEWANLLLERERPPGERARDAEVFTPWTEKRQSG